MALTHRYFSEKFQRYFDDPLEVESHLEANSDDQIREVIIASGHLGTILETPTGTSYFVREGVDVHELTFSGGNLSVNVASGAPVVNVNQDQLITTSGDLQSDIGLNTTSISDNAADISTVSGLLVNYVDLSTDQNISGLKTFTQDVTVNANLSVLGTTTYLDTQHLLVNDNIFTLNYSFSGTPNLNAGIEVERGAESRAQFIWDESNDYWTAGISGSMEKVIRTSDLSNLVTGPASSTNNALVRFDGTTGKLVADSKALVNDTGQMFVGTSGTFEPNYCMTIRCSSPSGNGLFLKASDSFASTALHIEDADGSLQLLDLSAEGELGLGTLAPEFTIDVQQTAGSGSGSVNVLNQYYKAGRRIDSQVQADLTIGTDLTSTNSELSLNTGSEVQVGTDFTVNANNITITNSGTYEVEWSVCGQMAGSNTGNRRRGLQAELNRNSGTIVQATRGGGYTRTVNTGNICQTTGSYLIVTTSADETVGLRTEDVSTQSTASITFTVQGGYLKVKRID